MYGVQIAFIISNFHPEFLWAPTQTSAAVTAITTNDGQTSTILTHLFDVWESPRRAERLASEEVHTASRLSFLDESRILAECYLNYARARPEDVSILWRLLVVFRLRTLTDFTFVIDFYSHIAETYSNSQKRAVLLEFVRWYSSDEPGATEWAKARAIRHLITPMLRGTLIEHAARKQPLPAETAVARAASVASSEIGAANDNNGNNGSGDKDSQGPNGFLPGDVLSYGLLESLMKLLGTTSEGGGNGGGAVAVVLDDDLRAELLRLSSMLIRYLQHDLVSWRKELIGFAWAHLKCENTLSKHWAYVSVCRFIVHYDTPVKIVHQVYVTLLYQYQSDNVQSLVRKAIDILMPALPVRLPTGEHHYPAWVKVRCPTFIHIM